MPGFSTIWGATYPLVTLDPTSNNYPAGRHLGNPLGLNHVDTDLLPSNIVAGVTIFGTAGTHGLFDRWLPSTIKIANSEEIVTPDQTDNEPAPLASPYVANITDDTSLKVLLPQPALTDAEAIETVDQSIAKSPTNTRKIDLEKVVDGAVADDGGAQTTETAAAQNATANDMTLLPATPAGNDAYYFGCEYLWDYLLLNVGTKGVGVWTLAWEYWDGGAWSALSGVTDLTVGFCPASNGIKSVSFTRGAGWATTAVNGITKYWIRARVSAYTSVATQPLGTQAWCGITI